MIEKRNDKKSQVSRGESWRNAWPVAIVAVSVVVIVAVWVSRDLWIRRGRVLSCSDGQRYEIDTRDFVTQYSAYSVKLEGKLKNGAQGSATLDPIQMQKLSEAVESANEFRKYLVAGYNTCAITRAQYAELGARFHTMEGVAHEIDSLSAKRTRSPAENLRLTELVDRYSDIANFKVQEGSGDRQ